MTTRHLRLVYNGPRSEHFQDGASTGKPKISPNHPAWGSTPWAERFPDGGQENYPEPKPQLQTGGSMSGGGEKPPAKTTMTGDDGEKKPKKPKNPNAHMQGTLFNMDDYR